MRLPTDQEIQQAKALALETFGSDAVGLIELDAPIDAAVIAAPVDQKGWAKYVDALHRDPVTAHGQVFAERTLWPRPMEASALRARWPAAPALIAAKLAAAAGDVPEVAVVRLLNMKALPVGLAEKDAAALVAGNPGAALWSVELPAVELSVVMRAPLPDTYLAAQTADREARVKGTDVIGSMAPYILETVVWSARAMSAFLDGRPAVIGDLRRAYLRMGGEGAAVRFKRL